MIRRAAGAARSAHRRHTRGYASGSPSGKISVVPFGQGIEAARTRMQIYSLVATPSLSTFLYASLLKLFGPSFEVVGREFGLGDVVKLKSIVPTYYPIWRVDAMAQGPVSPMRGGKEYPAYLSAAEAYVPGNPFAPMSYLSYAVPPLEHDLRPYEPSRDLHQLDGETIVEVPFTVNPLSMVGEIRKQIGRRTEILGGFKIDESKWKETLVAAYPVMFPIYIAEYEATLSEDNVRRFPVIMDAHGKTAGDCRCTFPPPPEVREAHEAKERKDRWFMDSTTFAPTISFAHPGPGRVPAMLTAGGTPDELFGQAYTTWMSPNREGSSMPASPTLRVSQQSEIDWNDPRIQSWTSEEREQNGEYMEKADDVYETISSYQRMSDALDGKGITLHLEGEEGKPSEDVFTLGLDGPIEKLREELDELKPKWLVEFDKGKETKQPAAKSSRAKKA